MLSTTQETTQLFDQSGRMPVLEEAIISGFYCFARKSQKKSAQEIMGSKKLDSRFHRSISKNFKASLSNVPWARVGNFWQSESIKTIVILKGPSMKPLPFWSPSNVSTCCYVLFFETNFPQNYNKLLLCRQSFIGGNKLVTSETISDSAECYTRLSVRFESSAACL